MAKLKYVGTLSAVSLDWECVVSPPAGSSGIRCVLNRGDTVEVTDQAAESLLASGNFEKAGSSGKKKED